jgi:hypothetical protein
MPESVPFSVRASRLIAAIRLAFVPAAVAWALALPLATFAASRAHASAAGATFVVTVYGIGSLICHQLPARSYHLWAAQMPVCARCTGIYVGAAIGALAAIAASLTRRPTTNRAAVGHATYRAAVGHRLSGAKAPRAALIAAALPTLLTLLYEWTTGEMPSQAIRAAAGFPIGVVVAWLVVAAADNRVN